ncbi:MAG: hypothetical protein QW335_06015, partial [Candidatus Nezhaarchaeales archaeon]
SLISQFLRLSHRETRQASSKTRISIDEVRGREVMLGNTTVLYDLESLKAQSRCMTKDLMKL